MKHMRRIYEEHKDGSVSELLYADIGLFEHTNGVEFIIRAIEAQLYQIDSYFSKGEIINHLFLKLAGADNKSPVTYYTINKEDGEETVSKTITEIICAYALEVISKALARNGLSPKGAELLSKNVDINGRKASYTVKYIDNVFTLNFDYRVLPEYVIGNTSKDTATFFLRDFAVENLLTGIKVKGRNPLLGACHGFAFKVKKEQENG